MDNGGEILAFLHLFAYDLNRILDILLNYFMYLKHFMIQFQIFMYVYSRQIILTLFLHTVFRIFYGCLHNIFFKINYTMIFNILYKIE